MSRVRPIEYVTREEFDALVNRHTLVEAVLAQVLETIDELEVEWTEDNLEDVGLVYPTTSWAGAASEFQGVGDFDPLVMERAADYGFDPSEHDPTLDEDAMVAQREARRLQKEAAGAEAKAAAAVAPVSLDETPPAPVAGPLDPIEAANQFQGVGEEGRTVE